MSARLPASPPTFIQAPLLELVWQGLAGSPLGVPIFRHVCLTNTPFVCTSVPTVSLRLRCDWSLGWQAVSAGSGQVVTFSCLHTIAWTHLTRSLTRGPHAEGNAGPEVQGKTNLPGLRIQSGVGSADKNQDQSLGAILINNHIYDERLPTDRRCREHSSLINSPR